ncbi:MAG: glycosyltransferase [Alphaproteobacteria bacterium]
MSASFVPRGGTRKIQGGYRRRPCLPPSPALGSKRQTSLSSGILVGADFRVLPDDPGFSGPRFRCHSRLQPTRYNFPDRWFFKIFFEKKFVFDHHDINPKLYEAKFGRGDIFHGLLLSPERWTFRAAGISIAINESYKAIAIDWGGMDPGRVIVVRSGPKIERLKIIPPVAAFRWGKKSLVGYVGVIGQQEGIGLLLEAAVHIVLGRKREDVHFGIVGGGPALAEMQRLAATVSIEDYVTFTGQVSDDDLLAMLNTADVCVNPDRVNDLNDKFTMNKIMEYMALGKPIVQFEMNAGRYSAGMLRCMPRPMIQGI